MDQITDFYALLENATTVDEETFDVRFEEIVTFVEQEKLNEATRLITAVLQEGMVDIRLVMYRFYAQFVSKGLSSLKEILPALIRMSNDYWEKISPVNARDKYLVTSLTWFLSAIGKKLKRTEKLLKDKKPDEFWKKSIKNLTQPEIEEILQMARQFADRFISNEEDNPLNQSMLYLIQWLEGLKGLVQDEKTEQKTVPLSKPIEDEAPKKQLSLQEILTSSEPMMHLFRKIQAFEALIEKRNFEKAALVSDDIAQMIKSFDPSTFFPKLFTNYFSLSAAHMDSLAEEWENKGSLKWDALHRLYQTDLEEFIRW